MKILKKLTVLATSVFFCSPLLSETITGHTFEHQFHTHVCEALQKYGSHATPRITFHRHQEMPTAFAIAHDGIPSITQSTIKARSTLTNEPKFIQKFVAYHEAAHIARRHTIQNILMTLPGAGLISCAYGKILKSLSQRHYPRFFARYGTLFITLPNLITQMGYFHITMGYRNRRDEHEADTMAAHALGCSSCLQDLATYYYGSFSQNGYLSAEDYTTIAEQYEGQYCKDHQPHR